MCRLAGNYKVGTGEVTGMGKAYCPKCKRKLIEVISSFECLSTWNKEERFYIPGDDCELVKRCPDCGTLLTEKDEKIRKKVSIESDHGSKPRKKGRRVAPALYARD